jgi:hypothetical protein
MIFLGTEIILWDKGNSQTDTEAGAFDAAAEGWQLFFCHPASISGTPSSSEEKP